MPTSFLSKPLSPRCLFHKTAQQVHIGVLVGLEEVPFGVVDEGMSVLGCGGVCFRHAAKKSVQPVAHMQHTRTQPESQIVWFASLCVLTHQWPCIEGAWASLPASHIHHGRFHSRKDLVLTSAFSK